MSLPVSATQLCIGLTGGIGCGKSTVARLFEEQGAGIIDTDAMAHRLTQTGGEAIAPIRSAFGTDYITATGALDRIRMRQLVFADADARHQLENILHPLILALCKEQLAACRSVPYTIMMAPLLLACPAFLALVQRVLLVNCTEQNQISRVRQRSGLDESEIRAIITQQLPRAESLARADDIIQNDGVCDDLKNQVAALHKQYLSMV